MARVSGMDDLFGDQPATAFAAGTDLPAPAPYNGVQPGYSESFGEYCAYRLPVGGHTVETIRDTLLDMLREARAAEAMTWRPRKLRSYTAMFPYMAEWLKGGEGDQLMLEFKAEMDRLAAPIEQVAPNWQRIWGLAA